MSYNLKKGKWKTRNEEYIIMLNKLADGLILEREDFKKSENQDNAIPHTSVIHRLKELESKHFVKQLKFNRRAKTGLPIPRYKLTLEGFIELFRLVNQKDQVDVTSKIEKFIPILSSEFEYLNEVVSDEQLLEILSLVCTNITINVTEYHKNDLKTTNSVIVFPASLLLENIGSVKLYEIKIVIPLHGTDFSISEKIFLSRRKREKDYSQMSKPELVIKKLLIFAFFHELLRRINQPYFERKKTRRFAETWVLEGIRSNKIFNAIFSKNLVRLERAFSDDVNQMRKVRSIISQKKPLFVKKKNN